MVLGTEMEPHSRSVRPLQDKEERDLVKKKKKLYHGHQNLHFTYFLYPEIVLL